MKPSYLMTALLVASTLACCGGTPKVTRHDDESVRPPDAAPTPRGNEAATGELRDALILLHRIHFGYDSAVILADARTALTEAAGPLRAHPEVPLYVDGHTDERGPSSYNLDLGERRARAVVEALARLGVEA
ncbi:MAG: OmpA family protein [Myxococcota bacterium]